MQIHNCIRIYSCIAIQGCILPVVSTNIGSDMAPESAKKRLSREESRRRTRQLLLDAAAVVIPREGFQGASVEGIVSEAGFSRGAFYSNFTNKDELFATLMEQLCDEDHRQLEAIFAQGGSAAEVRTNIRAYYAYTCRENQLFILYTEAQIHATRNEAFRKRLVELERTTSNRIADLAKRYFQEYAPQHQRPSNEEIAIGLTALSTGITFAQMLDPERIDDQKAIDVLMSFFDAIFGTRA